MRKIFSVAFLLCFLGIVQSQTTIYFESFNSGTRAFSLNTTDLGSDPNNNNKWIINSSYNSFFGNTPSQPAQITGNPQSTYLHIKSNLTQNATFNAPASGNSIAVMNAGISTVGYTNVSMDFWLLCMGHNSSTTSYYGKTYYSIDGGVTWVQNPTTYSQIGTWTKASAITNPLFDNQPDLRFAFMWVQNGGGGAKDPAFAVDDITVKGTGSVSNSISTSYTPSPALCPGATFTVDYTANGSFNGGNTFTVQLSNSSGSFTSPVNIGNISGTASGSIQASIPLDVIAGNGYRVRVVSSNPAVNGTDNGVNITLAATPSTPVIQHKN